jgi:redox-sensitive bicupin YhaK (pirin superfamily)
VRPHPHIHLATVTYLFEGEIVHKDSLGSDQPIDPGARDRDRCVDARFSPGASLSLPDDYPERALYVIEGSIRSGDRRGEAGDTWIFAKDT